MDFTGERVVPDKMAINIKTFTQHLTRYTWALNWCAGARVLDVACGTGYGMELMSSIAREVNGMDIDQESLDYAKATYNFHGKGGFSKKVNLEKEDFSEVIGIGRFNTITSFETIEHLANPDFFLENVKKALDDDGWFVFSIPNMSRTPYHKVLYDLEQTKQLIAKHFSKVKWYGQNNVDIGDCTPDKIFFIGVAQK